ncbi:MAG TPA: DsbC family protein [Ramlibacter sp.]|nr:DsbC family protein [Ramlibacter sp.]
MKLIKNVALAALLAAGLLAGLAQADEAAIRKAIPERLPQLGKIDEVSKTPMPGLFEVRIGTDLYYTDADGNFLVLGQIIDTRQKRNLTEERQDKLLAIDFSALPVKDAFTIVRGNGKRKIALFEDPNCGYCKKFERDLQKVDNVTVYLFLYPILGPDSIDKSRNIWCARDKGKAWQDWMVREQPVTTGTCDTEALDRNIEFGKKHRITGTPTLVFADGTRVPGAIGAPQVEKMLAAANR